MRRSCPRAPAVLVAALLACATVTACSDDDADASPSASAPTSAASPATGARAGTSSPSAGLTATPPAGSTETPPAGSSTTPAAAATTGTAPPPVPREPTAARSQTPEGATAFVNHYVALLDRAYRVAESGGVAAYEGPECAQCRVQAAEIAALRAKGQRAGGTAYTVVVEPPKVLRSTRYEVPVTLSRSAAPLVDRSGATVGRLRASTARLSVVLDWTGMGWQLSHLRPLRPA